MRAVRPLLPALFALALVILALPLSCGSSPPPTAHPTATFTPPPTATPVPTATPRPTPTPQPTATPPLNEADRAALVALYHATGGPGWMNNHKWLSDAPLGEWHGVITGAGGRVVDLQLRNNGLTGEIPPELGGLEGLTRLSLGGNELTGEIPPELGGLAGLTYLDLRGNGLSGEIPSALGGLTSLIWLYLDSNRLSGGIPAGLGRMSSLVWLDLHSNDISGEIPPELGNLVELSYLELHSNDLSGRIPPELGSLPYLETLTLSENQLSGEIPSELEGLPKLTTLTLSGNQLSGCVPPRLRNVAWENDLGALGLLLCEEEMALFRDPWDRFRLQIPAEWEETEPDSQETVFQSYDFQFSNPDGSWAVAVLVGDVGFPSLAEYADALESTLPEDNLEILVRSTVQTPQGLRVVVLEVSLEDDEAGEGVVFVYLLGDGTAITVIYGFPIGWPEVGRALAYRSFDTFRVN